MVDIKKLLQERGSVSKFEGVAPEGFILVHEQTLEDLKNWKVWQDWKNGDISIQELNKNNFDNN